MDIRSIESIAVLHHAVMQRQIDMAVLTKANDIARAQGDMAVELLDAAAATGARSTWTSGLHHGLDLLA